jgi:hypothetical protein
VRWGLPGGADWELSIVDGGDLPAGTGNPQHISWNPSGQPNPHSVVFTYDPVSRDTSLALDFPGGATPDFNSTWLDVPAAPAVNALLVRARADGADIATLSDLRVTLTATGQFFDLGTLVGDGNAEYVGILSPLLAQGFSVTANAAFQDGSRSVPLYQFKVGVAVVPLPAGVWLLGSALLGGLCIRRKRLA